MPVQRFQRSHVSCLPPGLSISYPNLDADKMCGKVLAIFVLLFAVLLAVYWPKGYPVPQLDDVLWAEGNSKTPDDSVRPFSIQIPDEVS